LVAAGFPVLDMAGLSVRSPVATTPATTVSKNDTVQGDSR